MYFKLRKNIMRRIAGLLALTTMCVSAFAYNITGSVTDTSGEPLVGASVRLLAPRDSSLVRAAVADNNGRFTLKDVPKGKFITEVSYIGSKTEFRNVTMADANLTLKPIALTESATMLRAAEVTGVRTPIKVMQDTIEYSAESYKVQPNAVVEDLLKRLPGVDVGSDGSITSNGKTISKILVDGKEFFSDDPSVASKNLPVNMVEKVQVVDRKSDLARLTGVDDGEEETVINLTVKKGMKNGWFGNAEAGYGTDNRYKGSFIVNRFWNGNQLTLLGGLNNINEPGFTDGASRFRRFGGDNGLTRSQALGVNFNVGNEEIFRVGGNVMYSHTDRRTTTRQERQYLVDPLQYVSSDKYAKDRGHNVRADFRLQWKPDSANTFDFRPNMSFNANDSYNNQSSLTRSAAMENITQSYNKAISDGTSWEFGAQLIYNHNFLSRPGRALSVFGQVRTSNVREKEDSWSRNVFYLLATDSLYDQYSDNHTWSNSVSARVTWTEPLGDVKKGNFLTFAYNFQYRWNNADKLTYDLPAYTEYEPSLFHIVTDSLLNPELSNRFRNNYMNQDIRVGYKHITSKTNLEVGVSAVPQMSKSINLINSERTIPARHTWNVAPYMRYRYKMTKSRSLNIDYRGNSNQPSISQLQPVEDKSDPLRIIVGNPELSPSFTHNVRFRFQDFNQQEQRSIMTMLNASVVQNSIVSSTTYDQETGGQRTTYRNVNGAWNASGGFMFSMPLRNKSWTTSLFSMLRYDHSVGYNNNARNVSSSFNLDLAPGVTFRPDHLQFELRPRYGLQTVANSRVSANNRTVHSYGGRFDGTFYTDFGLTVNTDLEYTATSGYASSYNTRTWMWNAQISYSFLRGQNATVSLKAYDILNQKSNIRRSITANYIDDTEYNSLTRYFMVSFSYRFNTFGKGNEPESRGRRFGGGPGGPPPGGGRGPVGPPPPGM